MRRCVEEASYFKVAGIAKCSILKAEARNSIPGFVTQLLGGTSRAAASPPSAFSAPLCPARSLAEPPEKPPTADFVLRDDGVCRLNMQLARNIVLNLGTGLDAKVHSMLIRLTPNSTRGNIDGTKEMDDPEINRTPGSQHQRSDYFAEIL